MSIVSSSGARPTIAGSHTDLPQSNGSADLRLVSETSTPPPPSRTTLNRDVSSEVFTAIYSGVHVFEMTCRGVSVMRRISDSALNATQILKVAGIEKGRRTKILEKEILTGPHEKVQGGYGKYQGTWISYEIGLALCERHQVREFLSTLLDLDPGNNASMNATPTKEQHQASVRRHLSNGRPIPVSGGSARSSAPIFDQSRIQGRGTSAAILGALQPIQRSNAAQANIPTFAYTSQTPSLHGSHSQNLGLHQVYNGSQHTTNGSQGTQMPEFRSVPFPQEVLSPLNHKTARDFDHSRELMTSIFLESDMSRVPDVLINSATQQEVDIDVPIDELGHTALHWASALARLPLVRALIGKGANPCRGNGTGETPLIRAVLVTNTMDQNTFIDLLEMLKSSICCQDLSKRTVLHHIAVTAGIKGRSAASRYYLDSLLEWIVTHGQKVDMDLTVFERTVVDVKDRNGDTALNIAARIGNRSLVQSLLEINADPYLANKAGIRPIDSGTVDTRIYKQPEGSSVIEPMATITPAVVQASGEVLSSMTTMIASLQKDYEEEMTAKSKMVENTNAQLREAGKALAELRCTIESGKLQMMKLEELNQRIQNTNRAIENETREFREAQTGSGPLPVIEDNPGTLDADHPYKVDPNVPDTFQSFSKESLHARILAYQQDIDMLNVLAVKLNDKSAAMEARCRKVVSECAGVTVDQVDVLLGQLLAAVQSDCSEEGGSDYNEASRIAGFLKILTPRA